MNKLFLLGTAAVVLFAFNAKAADSATGTAQVEVVKAFSIEHVNGKSLNFGRLFAKAGTITIAPNGTVTDTNKIALSGNTTSADEFEITGPAGQTATVDLDGTSVTLNGAGTASGKTLTVTGLTLSGASVTPADDNPVKVTVGGSLTVAADTTPGQYSGTYTVNIAY